MRSRISLAIEKIQAEAKIQYSHIAFVNHNSKLSFMNQIKVNQATHKVCAIMCLVFDTMMASFRRASGIQFQHFLQMVNRKVRQLRRDRWACLDSSLDKNLGPARAQNHLCVSPSPPSIMLSTGACIGKD